MTAHFVFKDKECNFEVPVKKRADGLMGPPVKCTVNTPTVTFNLELKGVQEKRAFYVVVGKPLKKMERT